MSFVLTICCEYHTLLSDFVQLDEEGCELSEMLRLTEDFLFSFKIKLAK